MDWPITDQLIGIGSTRRSCGRIHTYLSEPQHVDRLIKSFRTGQTNLPLFLEG